MKQFIALYGGGDTGKELDGTMVCFFLILFVCFLFVGGADELCACMRVLVFFL